MLPIPEPEAGAHDHHVPLLPRGHGGPDRGEERDPGVRGQADPDNPHVTEASGDPGGMLPRQRHEAVLARTQPDNTQRLTALHCHKYIIWKTEFRNPCLGGCV